MMKRNSIPDQVELAFDGELDSVVSLSILGDDDYNDFFDYDDEEDVYQSDGEARWKTDERETRNRSPPSVPQQPQRRQSVPAVPPPMMPRRKRTLKNTPSQGSRHALDYPQTASALPPVTPGFFKNMAPPKLPCRQQSVEATPQVPQTNFRDVCKQYPERKCKFASESRPTTPPRPHNRSPPAIAA